MIPEHREAFVNYLQEQGWDATVATPVGGANDYYLSLPIEVNIDGPNLRGPVVIDIDDEEGLLIIHTQEQKPWQSCICELELANPNSIAEMEQYLDVLKSDAYEKD